MFSVFGNSPPISSAFNVNPVQPPPTQSTAAAQPGASNAQIRALQCQAEQYLLGMFAATQSPLMPSLTRYNLLALQVQPDPVQAGQFLVTLGKTGDSITVNASIATQINSALHTIGQTRQQQSQRTASQPPPVHFHTQADYDRLPFPNLPGNRRLGLALDHYRNAPSGTESWRYLQPYLQNEIDAFRPVLDPEVKQLMLHRSSLSNCRGFLRKQGTDTNLLTFVHGKDGVQHPQHVHAALDGVLCGGPILFESYDGTERELRFGVLLRYDATWWLLDGDLGAPCALPDGENAAEYLARRFTVSGNISVMMRKDAMLPIPVNLSYLQQPGGGRDLFNGGVVNGLNALEASIIQRLLNTAIQQPSHAVLIPFLSSPGLHVATDLYSAGVVLLSHPTAGSAVVAYEANHPYQAVCAEMRVLALLQMQHAINNEAVMFARCMAMQPLPTSGEPATQGEYFFVNAARHDELLSAYGVQTGNTCAQQALSFLFGFPVSYLDLLQFAIDDERTRQPVQSHRAVRDRLHTGIELGMLARYAGQRLDIAPVNYHGNNQFGAIPVTSEGAITLRNQSAASIVAAALLDNPNIDRILVQVSDGQEMHQIGLRKDGSGCWWEGDGRQQQPRPCGTLQQALARQAAVTGQGAGTGVTVYIIPFTQPLMADGGGSMLPWSQFYTHQMMIAGHYRTHHLIGSAATLPATLGGLTGVIAMEDPVKVATLTPAVASVMHAIQQQLQVPPPNQAIGVSGNDASRVQHFQAMLQNPGVDYIAYLNQLSAACLQGILHKLISNHPGLTNVQRNLLNQAPPLSDQDRQQLQGILQTYYPTGWVPMTEDELLLLPDAISGDFVEECAGQYTPNGQRNTAQRTTDSDNTANFARGAIRRHLEYRLRSLDHPLPHLSRTQPGLFYGITYTGAAQRIQQGARCRFDFNQYLLDHYSAYLRDYRKPPNNDESLDDNVQDNQWKAARAYLFAREGQTSRLDLDNPIIQDPVPGLTSNWRQDKSSIKQNLIDAGLGLGHRFKLMSDTYGFLQWMMSNLNQLRSDYGNGVPAMVMIGRTYLPTMPAHCAKLWTDEARQAAEQFRLMLPRLRVGVPPHPPSVSTLATYLNGFIRHFLLWMESNPFPPDLFVTPPNARPLIFADDLAGVLDAFNYPRSQSQVLPATNAGRRQFLIAEAQANNLTLGPQVFKRLPESARNAWINRRCTEAADCSIRPAVQFYTGLQLTGGRLNTGVPPRFAQNALLLEHLIAQNPNLNPQVISRFRSWLRVVELAWNPAQPLVNPAIALLQDRTRTTFDDSIPWYWRGTQAGRDLCIAFDLLQSAPVLNQSEPLFLTENMTMFNRFIYPDPPAPVRPTEDAPLMLKLLKLLEGQRKDPTDNPVISELNTAEDADDFVTNAERLLGGVSQQLLTGQQSDTIRSFYHAW